MTRSLGDGHHTAAVSIRSGHGSMTHDRVMRFVPLFDSARQAAAYATTQALDWLDRRGTVAHPAASHHLQPESAAWPRKN